MKKIALYATALVFSLFVITSCEKDEIGGTATEKMAGEWYVTSVAVDDQGKVVYEDGDLFGLGKFHLDTYNTASNSSTEMWINDNKNFYYAFSAKLNIDLSTMTFKATDVQNASKANKITITDGKILLGAATTPSGTPADSIVFNVTFSDDKIPGDNGFKAYRIAGYRYTGLANDN